MFDSGPGVEGLARDRAGTHAPSPGVVPTGSPPSELPFKLITPPPAPFLIENSLIAEQSAILDATTQESGVVPDSIGSVPQNLSSPLARAPRLGILQRAFQNPGGTLQRFLEWIGPIRFHVPDAEKFGPLGDRFEKHAHPYIIPGTKDAQPLLYFSGLNATGYEWKEVARDYHHRYGVHSEVYTLPGHDGRWKSFLFVTDSDWIRFVHDRALAARARTGRLPILIGHSTAAIAIITAMAEYAEAHDGAPLAAGVILSGPPLKLLQTFKHAIPLIHADKELRRIPGAEMWNHFSAKMPRNDDPLLSELDRKNPSAAYVPVKLLVQLWRLIPRAQVAMRKLHVPVLVLQGSADHLVNPAAVERAMHTCPSEDKTFVSFPGGRHSSMFGTTKADFRRSIFEWLASRQVKFEAVERRLLRAEMYRAMAARQQQLVQKAKQPSSI
jgi:alpha-beta hydrolase superfamily lysophospholipase